MSPMHSTENNIIDPFALTVIDYLCCMFPHFSLQTHTHSDTDTDIHTQSDTYTHTPAGIYNLSINEYKLKMSLVKKSQFQSIAMLAWSLTV